jgi:hypothetical protein
MNDGTRRALGDLHPTGGGPRVERLLADGLADFAPSRAPDQLRPEIERTLSHVRPRPRWLTILKEPPMRYRSQLAFGSPTARVAALAAVTMLLAIVGAGALVAGAQSPSPAPPEVPTAMQPAWVTGTLSGGEPIGVQSGFFHTTDTLIEMSDPRLSGTLSQVFTVVKHPVAGDDTIRVFTGEYRIENEGGSWEGTNLGMERGAGPWDTVTDTGVLVGSGAYEGLTAYLMFDWSILSPPYEVTGAIFPGDLPPQVTFEELPVQ